MIFLAKNGQKKGGNLVVKSGNFKSSKLPPEQNENQKFHLLFLSLFSPPLIFPILIF